MKIERYLEPHERDLYFHRDYENDVGKPTYDQSSTDQAKRVALVALPFLSLSQPLQFPIALGMGGLRAYNNVTNVFECIKNNNLNDGGYYLLQTLISTASVAGTLIAHPLGMVLTTANDLLIEIVHLSKHIQAQDYEKAFESCAKIVNNALYLAFLLDGGIKLTIASLAAQITLCLYEGRKEWNAGHWLEAAGQMGMALARSVKLQSHLTKLQDEVHIQAPRPVEIADEITAVLDENDFPIAWIEDGQVVYWSDLQHKQDPVRPTTLILNDKDEIIEWAEGDITWTKGE
jgi:hypothetical protein